MLKHLFSNTEISSSDKNYRKLIAARFIIIFSFFIAAFFTLYNYLDNNEKLFYLDGSLLLLLVIVTAIYIKKDIFFISNILMTIMIISLVGLIFINRGQDGVLFWGYIPIFLLMTVAGHKKGLFFSSVLYLVFFVMAFNWIGESITSQGYIRFVVASIVMILLAFYYEYSSCKTINQLDSANIALKQMTRIDGLTALYNRRYFDEVFPEQIKISKRNKNLLAFAMLDIDSFKAYNDSYGHHAGDIVLKKLSATFKNTMQRPDDYVFRLGGEEFGILFSTNKIVDGVKKMEDILQNVEHLKIAHTENFASPYITISIGLYIAVPSNKSNYETIYKICDNALYSAKNKGKNRLELAS